MVPMAEMLRRYWMLPYHAVSKLSSPVPEEEDGGGGSVLFIVIEGSGDEIGGSVSKLGLINLII